MVMGSDGETGSTASLGFNCSSDRGSSRVQAVTWLVRQRRDSQRGVVNRRRCRRCGMDGLGSVGTAAASIGENGGVGRQWKLDGGSSLNLIMRNCRFVPWAGIEDE
ncbi:hypothetical protein M0R45_015416 [Rubus argutus]|uniref:Uncharacterized protein n=1 Tax=Rubus argutus TaxID=59490 RepID=A0AAW1XPM9_RUBAR